MIQTTIYEDKESPGKSGLDMYFYEEDGSTFKATILFEPYFYIICKVCPTSIRMNQPVIHHVTA